MGSVRWSGEGKCKVEWRGELGRHSGQRSGSRITVRGGRGGEGGKDG